MKKKKQKKSENQFWITVQEIWQNPKGKAMLFFGFYLLFFIFIGVSFRTTSHSSKTNFEIPNLSNQNKENYSVDGIEKGNYRFVYQENINGIVQSLEGKSYNKMKEITTSSNQTYFLYSGISLIRNEGVWQISASPFHIREIMEEDLLKEILSKATFISKTVYKNNETLYHYEISTTTLYQIYQHEEIDLDDLPNTIDLLVSKEGEISKITYHYSSYESYINGNITSSLIEVNYQDYGKIEEFSVPN